MNFYNSEKLKNITIKDLKHYFLKYGWIEDEEFPNKNLLAFKKTYDEEIFTIFIPSSEDFKDYMARLYDSLILISELEEVSLEDIIRDIYIVNSKMMVVDPLIKYNKKESIKSNENERDKLSVRVIADFAEEHILPMEYAQDVVKGIRNLIVAAIYLEEQPRKYFVRPSGSALETLNYFYLAQTEPGSYIFNIESDIEVESEQTRINDDSKLETMPITRRAISRIQKGIYIISESSKKGGIQELYEKGYLNGLNANMCDAILDFRGGRDDIQIETTVEWSELQPKPKDVPEKALLDSTEFSIIKSLSETYKENKPEDVMLRGRITSIDRDNKRIITIKARYKERERKIKIVKMNLKDFQQACEALKYSDNEVFVEGEIEKSGRTYTLYSYKNFKVKF